MTSSDHTAPRLTQLRYEPTATPTASVACPHCGGAVRFPEPRADVRPDVRIVPPVVSFDVTVVREPVGRVLGTLLEVLDGRRPADQLRTVAEPVVVRYARAARPTRPPQRVARVLSLRVSRPAEQAVEAAAVISLGGRIRAMASRFEQSPQGWRCAAVRIL